MTTLTEAVVEDAALAYLKSLGWTIAHSRTSLWAMSKLVSEELQVEVVEEFLGNSLCL